VKFYQHAEADVLIIQRSCHFVVQNRWRKFARHFLARNFKNKN